jgi:hypothetical protein
MILSGAWGKVIHEKKPEATTPAANFATSSPCVVDTCGKFATGVNDIGGKFAAGANDTGGKLPPVSTTPVANLPPVSLTPVANNWNNIRLQTVESELEGKNNIYTITQLLIFFLLKIFSICHRCR